MVLDDQQVKYLLRIDKSLKQYLAREARLNERSLNKEIIYRLRTSQGEEEAGAPAWVQDAKIKALR